MKLLIFMILMLKEIYDTEVQNVDSGLITLLPENPDEILDRLRPFTRKTRWE